MTMGLVLNDSKFGSLKATIVADDGDGAELIGKDFKTEPKVGSKHFQSCFNFDSKTKTG